MNTALHLIKARVAGEKESGADFDELKEAARSDPDSPVKFKLGPVTFDLLDVEDGTDNELTLSLTGLNKGVAWEMAVHYAGSSLTLHSVECNVSLPSLRDSLDAVQLSAKKATKQGVLATFTKLDQEIRGLGLLDFTKPSFKLGRYTMLRRKGRSSPSYISKEAVDGNPYVILNFTSRRAIETFDVVERFDGSGRDQPSYNDLSDPEDDVGADWHKLFSPKIAFKSPLDVAKIVEQHSKLLNLINNPNPGTPIEERGMLLNVKQEHVLFNKVKRSNELLDRDSFDDGNDAYLIFPNKEKLQSALDAIKVAVTTNGGRIVTHKNGALKL